MPVPDALTTPRSPLSPPPRPDLACEALETCVELLEFAPRFFRPVAERLAAVALALARPAAGVTQARVVHCAFGHDGGADTWDDMVLLHLLSGL